MKVQAIQTVTEATILNERCMECGWSSPNVLKVASALKSESPAVFPARTLTVYCVRGCSPIRTAERAVLSRVISIGWFSPSEYITV